MRKVILYIYIYYVIYMFCFFVMYMCVGFVIRNVFYKYVCFISELFLDEFFDLRESGILVLCYYLFIFVFMVNLIYVVL